MDKRHAKPGSVDDTTRVPVVDFAPTRIFRQARQVRTPVRLPSVIVDPDIKPGSLAHPRLVRRVRR